MTQTYPSLTVEDARDRARLVAVTGYDVELDLTGETTFASTSRVRFTCAEPGAETFLDVKAEEVHHATLNGADLDPACIVDGRLPLTGLAADNEVVVEATMRFSNDGQGLHRAVDPADGEAYVFGHMFLDAAPRVYACFDQPDLKAPYDIRVTAPAEWTVVGNGAATQTSPGKWTLATTRPLATYFVTVCAGPYVTVTGEHDGIPLAIHGRASLREQLEAQADEILTVTKQSFDHLHALFGIRYPFGEYHQVFVPEFNAGAMENPGCVTIRDEYLFRGQASDHERLVRATTIAHEMAHMWFGDLVTMRWWDDLWLNESFAEYMGNRVCAEATAFDSAWVDFTIARKTWGYAAERSPSTHPVAGTPAGDAQSALQNFDGISYAKGATILRQLVAYVGDDVFTAGLREHLGSHAYGNATLDDFLTAMSRAAGRDLGDWADAWLRTASLDVVAVDLAGDGTRVTSADVRREVPAAFRADRPHQIEVAGYDEGARVFSVPVLLDDDEVELDEVVGRRLPHVVVPDPTSLTWATVRLSPRTIQALPQELPRVPEALARAVVWTALLDGVHDAVLDPRRVVDVVEAAWPRETDASILSLVHIRLLPELLGRFLPAEERAGASARIVRAAEWLRDAHQAGTSPYLVAVRRLATSSGDVEWLRAVAAGTALPPPLDDDMDLRWIALTTLAARGLVDVAAIDDMLAQDNSRTGHLAALTATAALPSPEAKDRAWSQIVGGERSNHERNALASGFWLVEPETMPVVTPYVERFATDFPGLAGVLGEDALGYLARRAFPVVVVSEETGRTARSMLERDDLSAALRREVVDGLAAHDQALRSRTRYAGR